MSQAQKKTDVLYKSQKNEEENLVRVNVRCKIYLNLNPPRWIESTVVLSMMIHHLITDRDSYVVSQIPGQQGQLSIVKEDPNS